VFESAAPVTLYQMQFFDMVVEKHTKRGRPHSITGPLSVFTAYPLIPPASPARDSAPSNTTSTLLMLPMGDIGSGKSAVMNACLSSVGGPSNYFEEGEGVSTAKVTVFPFAVGNKSEVRFFDVPGYDFDSDAKSRAILLLLAQGAPVDFTYSKHDTQTAEGISSLVPVPANRPTAIALVVNIGPRVSKSTSDDKWPTLQYTVVAGGMFRSPEVVVTMNADAANRLKSSFDYVRSHEHEGRVSIFCTRFDLVIREIDRLASQTYWRPSAAVSAELHKSVNDQIQRTISRSIGMTSKVYIMAKEADEKHPTAQTLANCRELFVAMNVVSNK